jgi:apolipoprotein D and lipocalin family protein
MRYSLLTISLLILFACRHEPLPTVDAVDLERYAGKWYEIGSIPTRFQKGCRCTTAEYSLTDKNYVKVTNRCRREGEWDTAEGKAFVQKGSNNAKLKVQFFWPFKGKYWILALADDYSYAMVGHPNRDYLWILSREPQLPDAALRELLARAESLGFDTSRITYTEQEAC